MRHQKEFHALRRVHALVREIMQNTNDITLMN